MAGETIFQQASLYTVHHGILVFPVPAWVCFWAVNAWAVDSLAGSMKQDTLLP